MRNKEPPKDKISGNYSAFSTRVEAMEMLKIVQEYFNGSASLVG